MAAQLYSNPAAVEAILLAVAQQIRNGAGFFVAVDYVGERAAAPAFAGAPQPSLVEVEAVHAMLADGVKVDLIFDALLHAGGDWRATLLAALQSGDFITSPKIVGPVRSLQERKADGVIKGVDIFTDSGVIPGDRVLLILLPPGDRLSAVPVQSDGIERPVPKPAKEKQSAVRKAEEKKAIPLVAHWLKENRRLTIDDIVERLQEMDWRIPMTRSRVERKIVKRARKEADLPEKAKKGRPPEE